MPRLSDKKKEKISEHILSVLHDKFPESLFTSEIAEEVVRDEEFTKDLLHELHKKDLVIKINKNNKGINYLRRSRWRLSNKTHSFFSSRLPK